MRERKKRNIMQEFRVDEISVVDRPAQKGALAAIMKRDGVFDGQIADAENRLGSLRADIFEALQERARLVADSARQLEDVRDNVFTALEMDSESEALRGLMREIDQRLSVLRAERAEQGRRAATQTFKSEPTLDQQLERLRANPTRNAAVMLKIRCERDYGRLMRKSEDWAESEEYAKIDAAQREADAYMAYAP